jgi:dienelactone hydrolase
MVPVTVDGEQVKLAVTTYKPPGDGPFPTLIFHHGSTGRGDDPSLFAKPYDPKTLAEWFKARGWAVILPSRRGRGGSEGRYDEGFAIDRTQGYSCDPTLSLPGAERALRDIDAVTPILLAQPFVDRSRFVVGGQSRGGILTVAWAGRHPEMPRAAINFVGGWMAEGCPTATRINPPLFKKGAAFALPMLWLYGDRDRFYSLAYSRSNFASFQAAGGKGTFHAFTPPDGVMGHFIVNYPALWGDTMAGYLAERGL